LHELQTKSVGNIDLELNHYIYIYKYQEIEETDKGDGGRRDGGFLARSTRGSLEQSSTGV